MRGKSLLAFIPLALMAQIQPIRIVTSQAQRLGNQPIPGFQNGYLYFVDHATVRAYSPEGFPVLTAVVQMPDAENVWASGLAVDSDGTFAIGVSYGPSNQFGGIAFYDITDNPTDLSLPAHIYREVSVLRTTTRSGLSARSAAPEIT
jgi:hypothetical protein